MEAPRGRNPQSVLFACGFNSVRSPMAESLLQQMFPHALYVKSAGVKKGELDPFAVAVMAELGQDISQHKPMTFEELDDWEGLNFDLIITLSPEAHHKALELTRTLAAAVEYWPTHDPTGAPSSLRISNIRRLPVMPICSVKGPLPSWPSGAKRFCSIRS